MLLGLATSVFAQDLVAPGAEVSEAIVVQLTEPGLDAFGDLASSLVPTEPIVIDPIEESGFCYEYSLRNAWVGVALDDVIVRPREPGTLEFEIAVTAWVNDPADEFELSHDSCITSAETCYGYVLPFPATVTAPAAISVTADGQGQPVWSVNIDPISFTHGLTSDDIVFDSSCSVGDIEAVLSFFGLSIYELVIDYAEDYLTEELEAQAGGVEDEIELALLAAQYVDTIDLVGVPLDVSLLPRDFRVTSDGLVELAMGAAFSAPIDDCVAEFDLGGSLATPGASPGASELLPNTEAAVQISDDTINQALYAVWGAGLLCQSLAGGEFGGFAIDTTLLRLLGGDVYGTAFPETRPITLDTRPRAAPVIEWDGLHDLTIAVEELDLDMYTEVDGRQARVLGATVAADVGLDAVFDATTGELELVLDLGADVLDIFATSVGMVPVSDEELSAQVDSVLGAVLGTVVGSLVGDTLTFPLPSIEGIGLEDLDIHPSSDGTWGIVEAEVGPVTYGAEGCSSCTSTTESSCAVGPRGAPLGGLLLALVALRRRRRA